MRNSACLVDSLQVLCCSRETDKARITWIGFTFGRLWLPFTILQKVNDLCNRYVSLGHDPNPNASAQYYNPFETLLDY